MILLPIIDRELRARARGQANYWTRFCVALAAVLICVQSMQSNLFGTPSLTGSFAFNGIVGAAFLVSCSACLLTADAISAESREGTLGLLFITRVKILDVLLGKLGSIGIAAFCALLAFMPVLMVPVLAGGVTGGEAFRKGLGLLDGLFLSLVIGLFSSAAEQERFRATRGALLVLSIVVIVPFLAYVGWGRGIFFYAGLLSPLVLLLRAGDLAYTTSPTPYWISFAAVHLVSWGFLIQAGLRLKRAVVNEGGKVEARPLAAKHAERAIGLGVWQPVKTDSTPVEWLVYRQYGVHALIWTIGVLALACNAWVPLVRQAQGARNGPFFLAVASPLGTISGLIGGAMVAWVASRFFVGVRRSGDLELLLTTPVGAQSVLEDQWKVLKRLFVWPVLCMQAPMLPQFLAGLSGAHSNSAAAALGPDVTLLKLLTIANTFLGTAALCWLGLWFGFRARTQAGAIVWAVGLAKGLPSLLELLCSVLSGGVRSPMGATAEGYFIIWWIPELATSVFYLWLIALAKNSLVRDLVGRERPVPALAQRTSR